jgi:EpsD family peptidyl-prolyl cis-trans isomerase
MRNRRALVAVAATFSLALAACEQPPTTARNAVAATVGGETISEAELGSAVARLGLLDADESASARGKVLEALIDQHLVSNAARNAKLDQVPEIALALQQAQRQVLVEAYMERLFRNLTPPTEAEVRDYYTRHPELFGERKLYRVQELDLNLPPARMGEVEAQLKQGSSLAEFADWLKAQGIDFKSGGAVRPAEQIPAALLARLAVMQNGQVALVPAGDGHVRVLQLQGSQLQPVALEAARGPIERVLLGEKRKTLLEAEIRRLRADGKIGYASGFAPAVPARTGTP